MEVVSLFMVSFIHPFIKALSELDSRVVFMHCVHKHGLKIWRREKERESSDIDHCSKVSKKEKNISKKELRVGTKLAFGKAIALSSLGFQEPL